MIEITMPRLSDTMEEGAILSWQKKPGDRVEVGDVLAEIETDKATMEYEAYEAGTLSRVLVQEGDLVSVGAPIALLEDGTGDAGVSDAGGAGGAEDAGAAGGAAGAADGAAESAGAEDAGAAAGAAGGADGAAGGADGAAESAGAEDAGAAAGAPGGAKDIDGAAGGAGDGAVTAPTQSEDDATAADERRFASPLVRKLARENNLDLAEVSGTGPGGRIIRTDIEPLLEARASGDAHRANGAAGDGDGARGADDARGTTAEGGARSGDAGPRAAGSGGGALRAGAGVAGAGAAGAGAAGAGAGAAGAGGGAAGRSADEKRGSEAVALSNTRRVIARRLGESARSIPHFYVTAAADAESLVQLRSQLNEQLAAAGRPKVSINDLLIRASALALREHPLVNASYQGDDSATMLVHQRINIGVAVASENGLVVPVIEDADGKSVTRLGAEAKELVALANQKKLTPAQMSGGTFTISNLGMFGVEQFTAIINPPEGAILAVGGTSREPVVVGDEIVIRNRMRYTLSADHRIIDGALAARFLQTLTRLIENPWTIIA